MQRRQLNSAVELSSHARQTLNADEVMLTLSLRVVRQVSTAVAMILLLLTRPPERPVLHLKWM